MKFFVLGCLISSFVMSASESPSSRRSSKKMTSRSADKISNSANEHTQRSPKNRSELLKKVSDLSPETKNLKEKNPHVLPGMRGVVKSKSNPDQISGPLTLWSELDEALQVRKDSTLSPSPSPRSRLGSFSSPDAAGNSSSEQLLSPRNRALKSSEELTSPRSRVSSSHALVRVASLSACDQAIDGREQKKQLYRANLTSPEQRVFDAVGLKNLEFIKTQEHLLEVLSNLPQDEIKSRYMAYCRSTISLLGEKLENKRTALKNAGSVPYAESPRDDSQEAVTNLINAALKDDLSPRKIGLGRSPDDVRKQIQSSLVVARENRDRLIGAPRSPNNQSAGEQSLQRRSRAFSTSAASSSSNT